jgi:hypothetical protein
VSDRGLSGANTTEATAGLKRPCILYEGEFASGWLRLWSGVGDLAWNTYTWQGRGQLLEISPLSEGDDIVARGMKVTVVASTGIVATALGSFRQGMPGRVYLGFLNAAGALADDPILLFEGRADVQTFERQPDRARVTVAYEDELVDLLRPRIRRYTYEDQLLTDPTDGFFRHITALQDLSIVWGSDLNKEIGD